MDKILLGCACRNVLNAFYPALRDMDINRV